MHQKTNTRSDTTFFLLGGPLFTTQNISSSEDQSFITSLLTPTSSERPPDKKILPHGGKFNALHPLKFTPSVLCSMQYHTDAVSKRTSNNKHWNRRQGRKENILLTPDPTSQCL